MTVEGENIHKTVRTRLQFTPSPELNESMKEFLRHDVRSKMAQRAVSLSLFSLQSVALQLGHGVDANSRDIIADDKYEELVAGSSHHEFRLAPFAAIDDLEEGIALQFRLSLQHRERMWLIQPPLFPAEYSDNVDLYTLLPHDRLLGGQAVNVAFSKLRQRMGENRHDGSQIAPWSIYVTNSRVFHRWPYPKVIPKVDNDPLSQYLDNA